VAAFYPIAGRGKPPQAEVGGALALVSARSMGGGNAGISGG